MQGSCKGSVVHASSSGGSELCIVIHAKSRATMRCSGADLQLNSANTSEQVQRLVALLRTLAGPAPSLLAVVLLQAFVWMIV